MSQLLQLLPDRMRSANFLKSMQPCHQRFALRLKEQYGDLAASNYIRLNYGTPDERPVLRLSVDSLVKMKDETLILHRENKGILVELEIGPYHIPLNSVHPDARFIAIAICDGKPVGYAISKHKREAYTRSVMKVDTCDEILVYPVKIESSKKGARA
jgi:hypothetical protein